SQRVKVILAVRPRPVDLVVTRRLACRKQFARLIQRRLTGISVATCRMATGLTLGGQRAKTGWHRPRAGTRRRSQLDRLLVPAVPERDGGPANQGERADLVAAGGLRPRRGLLRPNHGTRGVTDLLVQPAGVLGVLGLYRPQDGTGRATSVPAETVQHAD